MRRSAIGTGKKSSTVENFIAGEKASVQQL
jgi:hypothetical protein